MMVPSLPGRWRVHLGMGVRPGRHLALTPWSGPAPPTPVAIRKHHLHNCFLSARDLPHREFPLEVWAGSF